MRDKPTPPPDHLSPRAAAIWRQMVPRLSNGLDRLDELPMVVLCTSYADYLDAQAQVDAHGSVVLGTTGQPVKNPYCLVLKESWERIRPLLGEFGLSPLARSKIRPGADDPAELELNF